jgi:hypothetical protein
MRGIMKRFAGLLICSGIFGAIGVFEVVVGLANLEKWPAGIFIGLGILVITAGFPLACASILRGVAREAEARSDGVVWRTSTEQHFRPWSDVHELFRIDYLDNRNAWGQTTIVFTDKVRVVFDQSLTNYMQLANAIQTFAAAAKLPAVLAEVEVQPVPFGPVTIRRDGVVVGHHDYPWEKVRFFSVRFGVLVLGVAGAKEDRREMVALHEIPHYLVVLHLLQHFGVPLKQLSLCG